MRMRHGSSFRINYTGRREIGDCRASWQSVEIHRKIWSSTVIYVIYYILNTWKSWFKAIIYFKINIVICYGVAKATSWQTGRTISWGSGGRQTQSIDLEWSKMSGLASQADPQYLEILEREKLLQQRLRLRSTFSVKSIWFLLIFSQWLFVRHPCELIS